jgi:hypothetical protein
MGREIDFFVRLRQRSMAYRNIQRALDTAKYRDLYEKLETEKQAIIRFHALRGEYSDMMILLDQARPISELTLQELKVIAAKHGIFDWCRAGRHSLIQALAKKGLK